MIALTGGSGYIGRRVVALARNRGMEIVALGRKPLGLPGVRRRLCQCRCPCCLLYCA